MKLSPVWLDHRVFSDNVHRLFVTLSYFWPDRFIQLLSLKPILILLLYLLVSIDPVYTGICDVFYLVLKKCFLSADLCLAYERLCVCFQVRISLKAVLK